jgi:ubiquinone/menaquinone biosynthesis C-methylase UbiE
MDEPQGLSMYSEVADWFHLLTAPAGYADEARYIHKALRRHVKGPLDTLVELGSGGGNTASHLKHDVRLTLTDIAEPMLALSRDLNPECEHIAGDMRTLRLDRTFDAVLVHDAVMYMTSAADLRAAMATAAIHLRPGGAAIFLPDVVRETFEPRTEHGGHDGAGRALRYLSWSYDPDPQDDTFITDFTMLLREDPAAVQVRYDRHVEGLFAEHEWLAMLDEAGIPAVVEQDPYGRRVFIGTNGG